MILEYNGVHGLKKKGSFTSFYIRTISPRPQVSFLPMVPDRGSLPALPQKISKRYTEEQAAAI